MPALDLNTVIAATNPQPLPGVGARTVGFNRNADGELSSQWFSRPADQRFTNIIDLQAAVTARRAVSRETSTDAVRGIGFRANPKDDADLQVAFLDRGGRGVVGNMTHYVFGQLAGLAHAPAGYLRQLPPYLAAENLNVSMAKRVEEERRDVKLLYTEAQGVVSLMAATSDSYGRVWDADVVAAVREIVGTGRGELGWKIPGVLNWSTMTYDPDAPVTPMTTSLYASDRDCFMFWADDRRPIEVGRLPSGEPDVMFRAFGIGNSEVGNGFLEAFSMYVRAICCNRNLWGVEGKERVRIRHNSGAPQRFVHEMVPSLRAFTSGDPAVLVQGVKAAKASLIGSKDEDIRKFLGSKGFTKAQASTVLKVVEEQEEHAARSVWDVVQGITAMARDVPHQDERLTLERRAGEMLDAVKTHLA